MLMVMKRLPVLALLLCLPACSPPTPQQRPSNRSPNSYTVLGQTYVPLQSHQGYAEDGVASWYGKDFHGKLTSNGEIYDMNAMTAAHKTLPLGVWVQVTNTRNGKETQVRINDRGPFVKGRIIDLSFAAAKLLDVVGSGTAPVKLVALGYRNQGEKAFRPADSYARGPFTIQVGAFTVADNARRLADRLRITHGSATIQTGWVNGKEFHRVRAGRFDTMDSATAAISTFAAEGYPNSFIVALD